jgi:Zn-dependent metalloprotease
MKRLQEFISEAIEVKEASEETKSFTFDFTDMENGEDIVKSLTDREGVTVDGNKVTVEIKKDTNVTNVQDILQQSIQTLRKSQKSINDETYGQKTAKLEKTLGEMNDFIDKVENPEEE